DRELEQGPALSLWAASLPEDAEVETFHAVAFSGDEGVAVTGFPELDEPDLVAVCVDFTTFPASPFVERLNELAPELPLVGGIGKAIVEPNLDIWSGDHCSVYPELVKGILFSSFKLNTPNGAYMGDVMPTILDLYNVKPTTNLDGRSLLVK
ncbi:MAG TPA: hypothetical protein VLV54_00070, partial [Thermoanaerobaculia bacterium]|nr:hypothetical protein [Thermoanaerobaculia bacterium]